MNVLLGELILTYIFIFLKRKTDEIKDLER